MEKKIGRPLSESEARKMRDALNATGRAIWFALCGWETFYATDTTDAATSSTASRAGSSR